MTGPVVVCKIGGSLLSLPDVADRVERVLAERGPSRPILVVGGGSAADAVRDWDRIHRLGDARAHDLAVESLRLTASLAVMLLDRAESCAGRSAVEAAWKRERWPVLGVAEFLAAEEPRATIPVPRSWDATTDGIAAWVAVHWPADELLLLKSCPRDPDEDWTTTAERDCVDPWFPTIAEHVPRIDWVDLRGTCPG